MPTPIDLSTLLAQTPHVAKVRTGSVAQSEAAQTELTKEAQLRQARRRGKVEETQKSEIVRKMDKDGGKDKPKDHPEHHASDAESSAEDVGPDTSLSGKIIDRRI